ncbi:MAG: glycoside hydrolase family 25 protein [Anaerostipes sp.]|nr:glycoside hydrolase family 25 protein [Anaerostipes sp.]
MKLNKRNKKELKIIVLCVCLISSLFYWVVQNIGFPINTFVRHGRIQVIDVSSYNGKINWRKVKDKKINHAILKIGSGIHGERRGNEDQMFAVNYRSARLASVHRGIYYYSYATTTDEAKAEAAHCLKLLKKHKINPSDLKLPVVYDMEESTTMDTGRENVTEIATTFLNEIEKAGYTPMLYSNASNLRKHFIYKEIKNYKIWVAHYTSSSQPAVVFQYHMWQYTDKANIPGANTERGHCDLNYYLVDKDGNLL